MPKGWLGVVAEARGVEVVEARAVVEADARARAMERAEGWLGVVVEARGVLGMAEGWLGVVPKAATVGAWRMSRSSRLVEYHSHTLARSRPL